MGSVDRIRGDLNVPGVPSIHGRVQDNVVKFEREREAPTGPTSFEGLFLDVHDRLYRALYFVTGSSADAEELLQDAFLKLWERWDRLDTIEDPVAYLFRVALNGVRMRTRRARVAARRVIPAAGTRDPVDEVNARRTRVGCSDSSPPPADRHRAHGHLRIQLEAGLAHHEHPADHRARARIARARGAALNGSQGGEDA